MTENLRILYYSTKSNGKDTLRVCTLVQPATKSPVHLDRTRTDISERIAEDDDLAIS